MEVTLESGDLTQRLLIEQDVGTEFDTTGTRIPDWEVWTGLEASSGYVWAAFTQLRGRELERAMLQFPEATHLITVWYVAGITPLKFRGKLGTRIFNFGVVNNVHEAGVKLEILAAEIVAI